MNTDKLMELERKWRAEANSLRDQCLQLSDPSYLHREAAKIDERADELAALRAEQAVGDEQRAREAGMLPDALVPHAKEWYRLCERRFTVDRMTISGQLAEAIVDAICALGTARQSEGVVLVPREPTPEMIAAGRDEFGAYVEDTDDDYRRIYRRFIAAAPGGEGEATQPERDGRGNG